MGDMVLRCEVWSKVEFNFVYEYRGLIVFCSCGGQDLENMVFMI